MVQNTLSRIMGLLVNDRTLRELTDGYFTTELINHSMTLAKAHKTVIGVTIPESDDKLAFWSDVRDAEERKITVNVIILSAYDTRSDYCNKVMNTATDILKGVTAVTFNNGIMYIDGIKYEINPADVVGRWIGTITLNVSEYVNR